MNEMTQTLGIVAMEPKGEYSSEAFYEKLNVVTYNDSTYMAKEDVMGEDPTTSTKWQLIGGGVRREDIVDNLESNDATKMLSAKQGNILNNKKINYYDSISSINNIKQGEMFKLKDFDTTFVVVNTPTISSLQITNQLYADVVSETASVDSLGITTTINPTLFAEIVEYARNKGIELTLLHKTYTLNDTITLTSANKLKLTGLGFDSVINYTGNNYAFIINSLQQSTLKDFTINCTNQGGGIYCKCNTGEEQLNRLTSTSFEKVYIYNSKNPFKNDCHCGYVTFEKCQFQIGTLDGIGMDFSGAYYPEFITIDRCQIVNLNRDIANTGKGIYFNSGIMLNIINNDIIGHYNGIEIDGTSTSEIVETINILENSIWDCLNKGIYINFSGSNPLHGLSIKNCCFRSSQREDTLDYGIHCVGVTGISIESISMMLATNRQVYLSACSNGYIKSIDARLTDIDQTKNQIASSLNFDYINKTASETINANSYKDIVIGNEYNIVNFHNYILTRRGSNNSTTGLALSNQSIANGKISFRLTNSTSESISVNVVGF